MRSVDVGVVPAGSASCGGDVAVFVINQPSLLTPFHSVLVSISAFTALSTVFIPYILQTTLCFLILFLHSCLCFIGHFNHISLCESLLQPWYNPLWLTMGVAIYVISFVCSHSNCSEQAQLWLSLTVDFGLKWWGTLCKQEMAVKMDVYMQNVHPFLLNDPFSSVPFRMVSVRLGEPCFIPSLKHFPAVPLKQFQYSSDLQWCYLVLSM